MKTLNALYESDWFLSLHEPTTYMVKGIIFIACLFLIVAVWKSICESVSEIIKNW